MLDNTYVKQGLSIAGIIALLAIAYSAVVYVSAYNDAIEPGSFRSFSVTGEGKAVVVPDVAEFSASVITQGGKDLAALQTSNTDKVNKLVSFVKSKNVDDKDIQTSGYRIEPRYQSYACGNAYLGGMERAPDACPPADIVGYTITQTVTVKVRDFKKAGEILGGVVGAGANSVSELNFTVDDPTAVRTAARTKAIAQARQQAEAIAKAGGFSVGELLSLDEGGYMPLAYEKFGRGGDMAVQSNVAVPAPAVEPGSQEFVVQVTLRYEID